ncbi:MAG: acyloxyacyl hydrolase [Gammaproteobacteria bacterium]|nr:MAG: acyloxyacyl hydrolase [Gammaproteobacteria bacterium]
MKYQGICSIFLGLVTLFCGHAQAVDGIAIDLGSGDESSDVIGASVRWNWEKKWFTDGEWYVGGYWEAGIGHWDGKSGEHSNDNITHVGVTPVFRLQRHQPLSNGTIPFFEGAIGFHVMSDDKIGDKDLGTNFAFGDHVAAGIQFGGQRQYELSARLRHFSNCGLDDSNPGMNFGEVRFGYLFR